MSTTELIDARLLRSVITVEDVYELTPQEELMLEEAGKEFDAGQGIPYNVYLEDLDQWFQEIDERFYTFMLPQGLNDFNTLPLFPS